MKKKYKIIIGVIIVILILAIVLMFALWPKKQEKGYTKKEIIELISKGFVDGDSKEELEGLMNQQIADKTMMSGDDAYLLKMPSQDNIDKYKLTNYVTNNKTYFDNLMKKVKENYEWKFDGEAKGNQETYFMSIKTYRYGVYLSDLEEMINQLMTRVSNSDPKDVNEYKAKVIAMKLLNSHLDEYIYNGDAKNVAITFTDIKSDETKNSLIQYLLDLAGYSNQTDENINTMIQNRQTRIQEYIDDAINNGTLNENDILEL